MNDKFKNKNGYHIDSYSLSKLASDLYNEAFLVRGYINIIYRLHDCLNNYKNELQVSTCFYNHIFLSFKYSSFMMISNLYDNDKKSVTVCRLLNDIINYVNGENAVNISEENLACKQYVLNNNELELLYLNKSTQKYKSIIDKIDFESNSDLQNVHLSIDLTEMEYALLLKLRLDQLFTDDKKNLIHKLRSKIYAHNDKETLEKDLNFEELDIDLLSKLCDLALDICIFIIKKIEDITLRKDNPSDECLLKTLDLVRIGLQNK